MDAMSLPSNDELVAREAWRGRGSILNIVGTTQNLDGKLDEKERQFADWYYECQKIVKIKLCFEVD